MGKIEVNGLRFYSHHGCMEQETKIGGNYQVDVVITADLELSAESDNLIDTVDYCAVHKIVAKEMAIPSKLIEHVGKRIVNSLKSELTSVLEVEVKVTKFSPPIDGDCDSVSVKIRG
ncbi:MAG: dihydroneopterin aldolase [Crocinitomicaceae bacterium]|nr:dihydroneopterin aldolase [Crocinitomicaceae bacterium]|tara:strand:+ start:1607 stop:1957 length:351 start_codon:yes stop_codon:yes gene_type:complete